MQWAITFLIVGILIGVFGYINLYCTDICASLPSSPEWLSNLTKDFYSNIVFTLIGTAITVIIIDSANEKRAEQALKAQLIREMGHPTDNGVALRAVRELKAHGWLTDGTLQNAYLFKANLQEADLVGADLQGAQLHHANLRKAVLSRTNLQGANISSTCFIGAFLYYTNLRDVEGISSEDKILINWFVAASAMRGAIMPDGKLYDGCLNLELDLFDAKMQGIDVAEPDAMAAYYSVSREQYELGQAFYVANLPMIEQEINEQTGNLDD